MGDPVNAALADTDALRADIALSRRIQTFCAWCGPAFVILLFGGWGVMGGFIPLIPASDSADQVAAAYSDGVNLHRVGNLLGLIGIFLTIPFFFAISMQIRLDVRERVAFAPDAIGHGDHLLQERSVRLDRHHRILDSRSGFRHLVHRDDGGPAAGDPRRSRVRQWVATKVVLGSISV